MTSRTYSLNLCSCNLASTCCLHALAFRTCRGLIAVNLSSVTTLDDRESMRGVYCWKLSALFHLQTTEQWRAACLYSCADFLVAGSKRRILFSSKVGKTSSASSEHFINQLYCLPALCDFSSRCLTSPSIELCKHFAMLFSAAGRACHV